MGYTYSPNRVEQWDYSAQAQYWRLLSENLERNCHYWKTRCEALEAGKP
ncbi:hypothetical protein [Arthrobacter sp. PAMC25284]|nr:hypothetical protein [Arthrobacter sp. PAMC25284]QYF89707.1 hypothetical protein KY499_17050 [Arthrobacter sp. PAMC25284]